MNAPERTAARRRARDRRIRRRRTLALGALLAVAALIALVLRSAEGGGSSSPRAADANRIGTRDRAGEGSHFGASTPVAFVARRLAAVLPSPLQDAAAVSLPDGTLALLGGLDGNDTSTAGVLILAGERVSARSRLPLPQHDAQGTLLGNDAYVFGGGQVSSYDHVLRFDPSMGSVVPAGVLPRATSDAAVAGVGGTAYVVGGYDGARALDTIVAWRPGTTARTVAHLPRALRYAAVAAVAGRLVIAGGTCGEAAQREILRFDPPSGRVVAIGRLPGALTHAPAVALNGMVYVLGGRGSAPHSQTREILAIDPATGAVTPAGRLPVALSDTAAAVLGTRVVLAGGQSASQTESSIYSLAPPVRGSGG